MLTQVMKAGHNSVKEKLMNNYVLTMKQSSDILQYHQK